LGRGDFISATDVAGTVLLLDGLRAGCDKSFL